MAFCLGIYNVAYKEYKYLYEELKKRTEYWTGLILEKMIYSLLIKNAGCPSKKEIGLINNYLVSLSSLSYNQFHRLTRASCLLNYFIHIQYENYLEPSKNIITTLSNQASRYKERKEIEIRIFFPLLKEQIARYSILKRQKNIRKFIYINIIAASQFISEKSMNLEAHGMACYIIASKFYEMQGLNSWNLILEFAFYNLGALYHTQKNYKQSLDYLVKALNNSKMFDGKSSVFAPKTFKKINQILESSVVEDKDSVKKFLRQNLKVLDFLDFDIETPDEQVFNLGNGIKKDKKAQLNLIGNSINCK